MQVSKQIIAVSVRTTRRAESHIEACQNCDPTADIRFGDVLDWLKVVYQGAEFVMSEPARCPKCRAEVLEHTLVEVRSPGYSSIEKSRLWEK